MCLPTTTGRAESGLLRVKRGAVLSVVHGQVCKIQKNPPLREAWGKMPSWFVEDFVHLNSCQPAEGVTINRININVVKLLDQQSLWLR